MNLKNTTPVLFVRDARQSADFYTGVLGMTIVSDFGGLNFMFKEGLAVWQILDDNIIPQKLGKDKIIDPGVVPRFELVFETEDIDEVYEALKSAGARLLHDINTELWGQRTIRFYDPDGHLLEVGEAMPVFVRRIYAEEGNDLEAAAKRMYMEPDMVKHFLA